MRKINWILNKKSVVWLAVLVALCITAVTVYAVLPAINLHSPASFPVDI